MTDQTEEEVSCKLEEKERAPEDESDFNEPGNSKEVTPEKEEV